LALPACCPAQAAASGKALDIALHLKGAMFQRDPSDNSRMVLLNVKRDDRGRWDRIWGFAPRISAAFIDGCVNSARIDDGRAELDITLRLPHDGWTPGGRGRYTLKLEKVEGAVYKGPMSGTYRGHAMSGLAEGRIRDRIAPPPASQRAVEPGEHPRILFRKSGVDRLKQRLKTPLGEAAVKMWGDDAISLGMRHWLLGDAEAPAKARRIVVELMNRRDCGSKNCRGRLWATRLEQIAVAYDLFYDAWDDAFKEKVRDYLLQITHRIFYGHGSFQKEISWSICGEMAGPIYYGAAVAGLALWGEKGDEPAPPAEVADEPVAIAPIGGYAPGEGVPVVKLESGRMPTQWLMACGFRPRNDDALQGTAARFLPAPGTKLTYKGKTESFRPVPPSGIWNHPKYTGGKPRLDVTTASGRAYNSASYFFTVIDNDRPRLVQYLTDHLDESYLAGRRIAEGEVVKLGKGLYPLLVCSRIGETVPWGKIATQPRLTDVSESEARGLLAKRRQQYEGAYADWKVDHEMWKRCGGADVRCQRTFELSRWIMYTLYREVIGDGGGQEAYRMHFLIGPHKYAALYRNMFGADASPYPDVSHFLPRKILCQLHVGDGKVIEQDMHSRQRFLSGGFWAENVDVSRQLFAGLFPVVPERYKPAVLWAWNYHAGVSGRDDAGKVLESNHPYGGEGPDGATDVFAFLNYPLEMQPKHPRDVLPPAWEVPFNGQFIFRNRLSGSDDFIVQFFAKTRGVGQTGGTADAGTFRVLGLGEMWTDGSAEHSRNTWNENNVKLPNDRINASAAGRVIYKRLEEDGSGVVTVDLRDVCSGSRGPLYENYGGVRYGGNFVDLGIRGLRSFAVDYSGRSGSPCLLAIVDRIDGGDARTWAWQLHQQRPQDGKRGEKRQRDFENVKVEGGTFTITKGDKTLRGTFVAPKGVDAEKVFREKGTTGREPHPTLFATGGDEFFVVVTIQKGPAPPVKVEGEGLAAVVTVGGQALAFDGGKIVFGRQNVAKIERGPQEAERERAEAKRAAEAAARPWQKPGFLLPAPLTEAEKVDPRDAVYTLVLRRGLGSRFEGAMDLNAYVDRTPGGFRAEGFGWTPRFNICAYDVDASGLKLAGDKLTGTLKVRMHPEPWTPQGAKVMTGEYRIDATVRGPDVTGTYRGAYGGSGLWGEVVGLVQNRPSVGDTCRVWLRSPKALFGHKNHSWATRAMFSFLLTGGDRVSDMHVQVPFGKSSFGGAAQDASGCKLTMDAASFRGTMDLEVTKIFPPDAYSKTGYSEKEAGQCARYAYTIDGRRVGNLIAGKIHARMTDATEHAYAHDAKLRKAREKYRQAVAAGRKAKPPKGHSAAGSGDASCFIGGILPAEAEIPKMKPAERLGNW
jgi:hypothetical protein